mgnify:CR=1 FL=1
MSNAMFAYRVFDSGIRIGSSGEAGDIVRNINSITVDAAISPFSNIAIAFATDNFNGTIENSRIMLDGIYYIGEDTLARLASDTSTISNTAFIGFWQSAFESGRDTDLFYTMTFKPNDDSVKFDINKNKYVTNLNAAYDEYNPYHNLNQSALNARSTYASWVANLMEFFNKSLPFANTSSSSANRVMTNIENEANNPMFIPVQQLDWINANSSTFFPKLADALDELNIRQEDFRIYVLEFCQYAMYTDRNTDPLNPDDLPMCSFRSITIR